MTRPLTRCARNIFLFAAVLAAVPLPVVSAAVISSSYSGANNGNWSVGTNWTPAGAPINNGTNQFDVTISSISNVNFDVSGSNNINSLAMTSAGLTLNSGTGLTVLNSGSLTGSGVTANNAAFSSSTISTVDSTGLTSNTGGAITLSGVTASTTANDGANHAWTAAGTGAVVSLNALTTLHLQGSANFFLSATGGGLLTAASLNTLDHVGTRVLAIQAFDASTVNLPALGGSALSGISVEIRDGGSVAWGTPTSLTSSSITIEGASTIDTSGISDADASQFSVAHGISSPLTAGSLSLPALVSYAAVNLNINEIWSADGASSTLSANNLTTIDLAGGANLFFNATNGGTINLNALTTLTHSGTRNLVFQAFGTGSTINLAGISAGGISNGNVFIDLRDGGALNWGTPATFTGSSLTVRGAATITTSSLTNVDASQFEVDNGIAFPATPGSLSLPAVTSYTPLNANVNEIWSANGAGSTFSANSLATINLVGQASLFIAATSGGIVNLNALTTLNQTGTRNLQLQSVGAGSAINLAGISAGGISGANVFIDVRDGAAVNWGTPATFSGASLTVRGAATITTSSLTNVDASQFEVDKGIASPTTPGSLSLPAITSYTAANANVNEIWSANGAGSSLSANSLTTLHLVGFASFLVTATTGGTVNLNALTTLDHASGTRIASFRAFNANSVINLLSLDSLAGNDSVEVQDHGQANLGGFASAFSLDFKADFANLNGPLEILLDGSPFTSIAAHDQGTFDSYHFDLPGSPNAAVSFLANGDNAAIVIENYQVTSTTVPEPGSLSLLGLGSVGLLTRRRKKESRL